MAFEEEIKAASETYRVPEPLIKAFIRVESNWQPNATRFEKHLNESSYGLMQILLSTAREVTKRPTLTPKELLNPKVNIFTGTSYLSTQLRKYPNPDMAFSAYNAGRPIYSKIIPGRFVNQDYVNKINKYWREYSNLGPYVAIVLALAGLGYWYLQKKR